MGILSVSTAANKLPLATGDPWQVLTPKEKVVVLQKMLSEEIGKTLPRVVRSIF